MVRLTYFKMGFQGIPQSHSSVIKSSLSRLGFKKRYIKLGRLSGRPTANVPSGDKITHFSREIPAKESLVFAP